MAKRTSRKRFDRISFGFSCKFVPVPRDDEEVLDVFTNDLAVVSPEWCDGVQKESQRI